MGIGKDFALRSSTLCVTLISIPAIGILEFIKATSTIDPSPTLTSRSAPSTFSERGWPTIDWQIWQVLLIIGA